MNHGAAATPEAVLGLLQRSSLEGSIRVALAERAMRESLTIQEVHRAIVEAQEIRDLCALVNSPSASVYVTLGVDPLELGQLFRVMPGAFPIPKGGRA